MRNYTIYFGGNMKIINNISLKDYTTLKIGGIARRFYIIEDDNDLVELVKEVQDNYYIIANGSNILINDKKVFDNVVYMNNYNKYININNGIIEASSSNKIQELINFANKFELGGIEYLNSVPATVGGAICMNAGRGKSYNKSISDYIIDVKIFDGKKIRVIDKEECKFSYRDSIFKSKKWIILSARFKFENITIDESNKLKAERIAYSKNIQDSRNRTAGSVFCIHNSKIMSILKRFNVGWKKGVCYSNKTNNWINNKGNGTYRQVKFLINLTILLHKIFLKDCKLEYIEWK